MKSRTPDIGRINSQEYEEIYPDRLHASEIEDGQLLSLNVRSLGDNYRAYRMSVQVEQISRRLGEASLKTIILDADLKPATRHIESAVDSGNHWLSPRFAVVDNGHTIPTPQGYFVPYDTGEIDMFLLESSELVLSPSRTLIQ